MGLGGGVSGITGVGVRHEKRRQLRHSFRSVRVGSALAVLLLVVSPALGQLRQVDLFLAPAVQNVDVGETVRVDFFARSATIQSVPIAAISAVLDWDPTKLALLGRQDNGPYAWGASRFPIAFGLNDTFDDGDALYEAHSPVLPPAIPASAPGSDTGGLLVTSFLFEALAPTPGTLFLTPRHSDPPNLLTITQVVFGGEPPGLDVLGNIDGATITIVPEPGVAVLLATAVFVMLGRARRRLNGGSPAR